MRLVFVLIFSFWADYAVAQVQIASWNLPGLHHEDGARAGPSSPLRTAEDFGRLASFADELKLDIIALQGVTSQEAAHRLFPKSDFWIHGAPKLSEDGDAVAGSGFHSAFAIRKTGLFEVVDVGEVSALAVEHLEPGSGETPEDRRNPSGNWITVDYEGQTLTLLNVELQPGCADARLTLVDKNDRRRAQDSNRYACRTLLTQALLLENWIEQQHALGRSIVVLGEFNRYLNETNGRARVVDDFWSVIDDRSPESLILRKAPTGFKYSCSEESGEAEIIPTSFVVYDSSLDGWISPESVGPAAMPSAIAPGEIAQCPIVLEFDRPAP